MDLFLFGAFLFRVVKQDPKTDSFRGALCGLAKKCIGVYIMMTFFVLGNLCGICTEKLMQERENRYDFLRKVG